MADIQPRKRYVNEFVTADYVGVKVQTLRDWRLKRKGIPYSKVGKLVRYDLDAVDQYMRSTCIGGNHPEAA